MSFSGSTCHQGLKTAPGGDFFMRDRNSSTDVMKHQAPTSKLQRSSNHQAARRKSALLLVFGLWSFFGCWSFEFGAYASDVRLFPCGDVMTGRSIDQVLPHPSNPVLYEPYVRDARDYVDLASMRGSSISRATIV